MMSQTTAFATVEGNRAHNGTNLAQLKTRSFRTVHLDVVHRLLELSHQKSLWSDPPLMLCGSLTS